MSLGALAALISMPISTLVKIETRRKVRVYVDELVRIGQELDIPWWEMADPVNRGAVPKK